MEAGSSGLASWGGLGMPFACFLAALECAVVRLRFAILYTQSGNLEESEISVDYCKQDRFCRAWSREVAIASALRPKCPGGKLSNSSVRATGGAWPGLVGWAGMSTRIVPSTTITQSTLSTFRDSRTNRHRRHLIRFYTLLLLLNLV